MRFRIAMTALLLLAGCGSGGTAGTNYADPPPEAEIVATPSASPSAAPDAASDSEAETAPASTVDPATGLPADVAAYVQKRDSCAHWRGEEATDDARRKEIADAVARDCTGLDDELKRLRGSYMSDEKVRAALDSETD